MAGQRTNQLLRLLAQVRTPEEEVKIRQELEQEEKKAARMAGTAEEESPLQLLEPIPQIVPSPAQDKDRVPDFEGEERLRRFLETFPAQDKKRVLVPTEHPDRPERQPRRERERAAPERPERQPRRELLFPGVPHLGRRPERAMLDQEEPPRPEAAPQERASVQIGDKIKQAKRAAFDLLKPIIAVEGSGAEDIQARMKAVMHRAPNTAEGMRLIAGELSALNEEHPIFRKHLSNALDVLKEAWPLGRQLEEALEKEMPAAIEAARIGDPAAAAVAKERAEKISGGLLGLSPEATGAAAAAEKARKALEPPTPPPPPVDPNDPRVKEGAEKVKQVAEGVSSLSPEEQGLFTEELRILNDALERAKSDDRLLYIFQIIASMARMGDIPVNLPQLEPKLPELQREKRALLGRRRAEIGEERESALERAVKERSTEAQVFERAVRGAGQAEVRERAVDTFASRAFFYLDSTAKSDTNFQEALATRAADPLAAAAPATHSAIQGVIAAIKRQAETRGEEISDDAALALTIKQLKLSAGIKE